MAETLSTISIISFAVAGVSLILAVVLWFVFKIPMVIGDLSGRNAQKSIARMRQSNEKSGSKSYRVSGTNAARGKLTGTLAGIGKQSSEKAKEVKSSAGNQMPETGLIRENTAELQEEATALLDGAGETDLLEETPAQPAKRVGGVKMKMLEDVMLIHTDETI